MAIIATPARRRAVMVALLLLAAAGAVVRQTAPNPSTLRDVGTLLLVLWLPAVGNLVAWLVRRMPRRAAPATDFAAGAPFTPHLRVQLERAGDAALSDAQDTRCAILLGGQGFRARLDQPVMHAIGQPGPHAVWLEFLRPAVATPLLPAGTEFHLLVGNTGVAKGRVLDAGSSPA
jgi:hypothetical protein